MRNSLKTTKFALALVSAPVLALGVAACGENSNDSSTNAAESTVAVTESASDSASSESAASDSSASSQQESETSSAAAGVGNSSSEAPNMKLGGNTIDNATFQPVRCEEGEDDGRAQIEYKAGENNSDNELDIDIYKDDLKLDSLDLELDRAEWEVEDADKGNAQVSENNGKYTVKATVTKDDSNNEKQDIEVTFTC